jgi:hypothetical protein
MILKKIKNPRLGILGGEMDKVRLHKEGLLHNWAKKRVEKQIPPCLYYKTKTPSIIFGLKIITPSYTQKGWTKKLGLHSDIHL